MLKIVPKKGRNGNDTNGNHQKWIILDSPFEYLVGSRMLSSKDPWNGSRKSTVAINWRTDTRLIAGIDVGPSAQRVLPGGRRRPATRRLRLGVGRRARRVQIRGQSARRRPQVSLCPGHIESTFTELARLDGLLCSYSLDWTVTIQRLPSGFTCHQVGVLFRVWRHRMGDIVRRGGRPQGRRHCPAAHRLRGLSAPRENPLQTHRHLWVTPKYFIPIGPSSDLEVWLESIRSHQSRTSSGKQRPIRSQPSTVLERIWFRNIKPEITLNQNLERNFSISLWDLVNRESTMALVPFRSTSSRSTNLDTSLGVKSTTFTQLANYYWSQFLSFVMKSYSY